MQVMHVGHMRVAVTQRLVRMRVTVHARRHRFVRVVVMAIVVCMRMLVLRDLVHMVMGMRFRQM